MFKLVKCNVDLLHCFSCEFHSVHIFHLIHIDIIGYHSMSSSISTKDIQLRQSILHMFRPYIQVHHKSILNKFIMTIYQYNISKCQIKITTHYIKLTKDVTWSCYFLKLCYFRWYFCEQMCLRKRRHSNPYDIHFFHVSSML